MRAGLVAAVLAPISLLAQSSPSRAAEVGTIIVAHGADSTWNAPVKALSTAVSTGGPVRIAFLMGHEAATHRFGDMATELESLGVREIVVVPLLVSSHSEHFRQIRWLAGLEDSVDARLAEHMHHAGMERAKVNVPMRVAAGLDDDSALAEVLSERALTLAKSPREQALFLVAHGPNDASDYARWMENLRLVADRVQASGGFRDVRVDAVRDDAPAHVRAEAVRRVRELITLQHGVTQRDVVVVPILISRGALTRSTLAADLKGLPIVYAGDALLPHPALVDWIERVVRSTATRAP